MASRLEFVKFVCSQLEESGDVRYRKMFGDYMIYIHEKPVVLVCDNIVYVKKHSEIAKLMREAETGFPYQGAREHYILDVEHKDRLLKVVSTLERVLPYPKNKKERTGQHALREIPNVGQQTEQDLLALGYTSIESLKGKRADDLYQAECRLRGCKIDRCQLYLFRALEYYVNSENLDKEKCKWWYWKDDYFLPSPCGARCVECNAFPRTCKGCRKIKGKVFWLLYTGEDVCPIWQCCQKQGWENCAGCLKLPCDRFRKDPSITDEENEASLKRMIGNLSKNHNE